LIWINDCQANNSPAGGCRPGDSAATEQHHGQRVFIETAANPACSMPRRCGDESGAHRGALRDLRQRRALRTLRWDRTRPTRSGGDGVPRTSTRLPGASGRD